MQYTDQELRDAIKCTNIYITSIRGNTYNVHEFITLLIIHGKIVIFHEFMCARYGNPCRSALWYIKDMHKHKKWHMMHFYADTYMKDSRHVAISAEVNN